MSFDKSLPIVAAKFENFVFVTPVGPIWLALGGSLYANIQGEVNLQANLDIPVSKKFAKQFTLKFDNGKFVSITKEKGTPAKVTFSLAGSLQAKLDLTLTPALDIIFMGMPAMVKFDFILSGQGTVVGDISTQFGGKDPALSFKEIGSSDKKNQSVVKNEQRLRAVTSAKFCGG